MNKKIVLYLCSISIFLVATISWIYLGKKENQPKTRSLEATVLAASKNQITVQDSQNVIYTFLIDDLIPDVGSRVVIEYTGLLDKNTEHQEGRVKEYAPSPRGNNEDGIPYAWLDDGIFSQYYILANEKLKTLSLDEKIGQLFLVRYPDNAKEILKDYPLGGFVFFEKDFKDKSSKEVQNMIKELQEKSKIPLLTAVDEEGGKVVRISSNPKLANEKFKSSQELYAEGGWDAITRNTIEKSELLGNLGINLNLAPVVDVSTDPNDYIYERSFGKNTDLTSKYAKTVIEASHGGKVSYTLKHFPGYGNNSDTHQGGSTDNRTLEAIRQNDLPPFEAGIEVGAEAVLVSHNTITNLDSSSPASLSPSVHNLLRNDLGFTGIIMTDNMDMAAVSSIPNAVVKALLAGNDLIITTDYQEAFRSVNNALEDGTLSEELIDKLAFRILAWKYYKGLMFEIQK